MFTEKLEKVGFNGRHNYFISYHCFVSRIMGGANTQYITRHKRAFLTTVHALDKLQDIDEIVNALTTKVNLFTLLNITDQVE